MKDTFNYFTFSIFMDYDFNTLATIVKNCYKKAIMNGRVHISNMTLHIEDYFNPNGGNMENCVWWESKLYPNMTFFTSKQEDGLLSLCYMLRKYLQCPMLQCAVTTNSNAPVPMSKFYYFTNVQERIIMAYKEDRWVFFQSGTPLSIEDIELYKNRFVKKRINYSIIKEYLKRLNINLLDIDKDVINCMQLKRTEWGDLPTFFRKESGHTEYSEW